MQLGFSLLSAVMYRTGKLFHGSTMFLLFPLVIYIVATTLLLDVEGAHASPSQSKIKEAQKIIGRFLRDEAGTVWLAELAKSKSAPLTTQDLMNAILEATRKGGRVWEAAYILSEALKSQTVDGTRPESLMGQNDNWKDLISNIELEDDIICLYRKSLNETAKKSDDWKKFLRSVSPGYTIHVAIDTGRKYVICLKKIDVPETTTDEHLTTQTFLSTAQTSVFQSEATEETVSQFPLKSETLSTTPPSSKVKTINQGDVASNESNDSCNEENIGDMKGIRNDDGCDRSDTNDEDIEDDYENYDDDYNSDYEDSFENEEELDKPKQGSRKDLSTESNDTVNSEIESRRPIGERQYSTKTEDLPISYSSTRIPKRLEPETVHNPECKRPIIFVVPNGNVPSPYQPPLPIGMPIHQNPGQNNLPWPPKNPVTYSNVPGIPSDYLYLRHNSPNLLKPQNQGKPIVPLKTFAHKELYRPVTPQNIHFQHEISNGKRQTVRSFMRPTMKSIQTIGNVHNFNLPNMKSPRINNSPSRSNFILNPRYSISNSWPRRTESPPVMKIHNRSPLPIYGSPRPEHWRIGAGNVLSQKRVEKPNHARYNLLSRVAPERNRYTSSELIKHPANIRLPPRVPTVRSDIIESRPPKRPTAKFQQPMFYGRFNIIKHSPIMNQNDKGMNPTLIKLFRLAQKWPQVPCINCNAIRNYPMETSVMQEICPMSNVINPTISPNFNVPYSAYSNHFNIPCIVNPSSCPLLKCNDPVNCLKLNQQLRNWQFSCPSLCNRPIQLQIVINGKVQEPLSVSVLTESGQGLQIVGSGNLAMPYRSKALMGGGTLRNEVYDEKNIQLEVAERIGKGEEETADVPSIDKILVGNDDLDDEGNLSMRNETKGANLAPTMELSEDQEIGDSFLHDTTTEPNANMIVNETMSTTTNYTMMV